MLLQQLPKLLGRVRVRGGHQIRRGLPGVKEEHIFHGHRLNDRIGRMGISKYVKHISNRSAYEGSQHSTFNICQIWRESKALEDFLTVVMASQTILGVARVLSRKHISSGKCLWSNQYWFHISSTPKIMEMGYADTDSLLRATGNQPKKNW